MIEIIRVIPVFLSLIAVARVFFLTRTDIAIEVLALRLQLAVLKGKWPRPKLSPGIGCSGRSCALFGLASEAALVIVRPETVSSVQGLRN